MKTCRNYRAFGAGIIYKYLTLANHRSEMFHPLPTPNNLKQKIRKDHRASQKNAEGSSRKQDRGFDKLERQFQAYRNSIEILISECDTYSLAILSCLEHSINFSKSFGRIKNADNYDTPTSPSFEMGSSVISKKLQNSPTYNPNHGIYSPWEFSPETESSVFNVAAFGKRLERARDKITADLALLRQNAKQPLLKLQEICRHIQATVIERQSIISEHNKYASKFNYLEAKNSKHLSVRQKQNELRYNKNMKLSAIKFESINATLKVELRVFFRFFQDFLSHWFPNYFYITYTVAYTLYSFLGNCPEVRKLLGHTELHFSEQYVHSEASVLDSFHLRFDPIAKQIDRFKITCSSRLLRDSLTTASNTFKFQFEDNAADGTVSTLYATAICSYQPESSQPQVLAFRNGDIIQVIKKSNTTWWYGRLLRNKRRGYFPVNHVQLERYL